MKNSISFLLVLLMISFCFIQCELNDDDQMVPLPTSIEDYLATNYPDYSIDESEEDLLCDGTPVFEVEIEGPNDDEMELTFDTEGNMLFSETEINNNDLPAAVSSSIASNYANYNIDEAEKLNMFNGDTQYEVEISNGSTTLDVLLTADGTVLCEEEDTE